MICFDLDATRVSVPEDEGQRKTNASCVCLCTRYHEGGGGSEVLTHHIAIGLRRRGHDVEIRYLYDYIAREKSPWERILYEGRPRGPASAFAIAYEFIGALIDFRPDAIVAFHPLPNILGTVAGSVRLRSGAGRVATHAGRVLPAVAEVVGPRPGLVVRLYEKYRRLAHVGQHVRRLSRRPSD